MSDWRVAKVTTASAEGARSDVGWVNGPIGVVLLWPPGPKRGAAPTWEVVHLATGHAIVEVVGGRRAAEGAAEALLALGDWTWSSLDGWRNADPELEARVRGWVRTRHDVRFASGERFGALAREIGARS